MIRKRSGEIWKSIQFPGYKTLRNKYAVSSIGRIASFKKDIYEDGKLLGGSTTNGYTTITHRSFEGYGTIYIHREIAKAFCKRKSPKQKYVIHLNHKKHDNHYKNLKWAVIDEVASHQQLSPDKIAYKKRQATRTKGLKLSVAQVKAIKDILKNPKRRLTCIQLAAKYKVSGITIYRIKNGESWGRVK